MDVHSPTYRKSRFYIFISMWFLYFGQGSMIPHLTRYYDLDLQIGDQRLGLMMAIPMICVILCQPLWGYLADRRIGRSNAYRLCLALASLSAFLFPFASRLNHFPILLANAILLTIGYISMAGLSNSVVFSFLGPQERRHFGRIRWIGSISFMAAAFLLGPPLVDWSHQLGFQGRILVFFAGSLCFLIAILLSRWQEADFQPHTPPKHYSFRFLNNRNLLCFYFTIFCGGAGSSAVMLYLGPYIGHLGYSESFFSILWLAGITCESALGFHLDKIVKYTGIKAVIVFGCFAEGLRWLLFLYFDSPVAIVLIFMLHGPTIVGYFYASAVYLDSSCKESIRSTAQTFLIFAFFLGQVFAFFVASTLVGANDALPRVEAIRHSFYFYSFMGFLGAIFGAFFIRKEKSV